MGKFSFFGVSGLDNLYIKDVKPTTWITPGDDKMMPDITQDFNKDNYLVNIGMNHIFNINTRSYIKTSAIYSQTSMDDDVYKSTIIGNEPNKLSYSSKIKSSIYTLAVKYNNKLNVKNTLQTGIEYAVHHINTLQNQLDKESNNLFALTDYQGNIGVLQNYVTWKHNFNEQLTFVAGLHNTNVLLNSKNTIEPRVAMNWNMTSTSVISAGYGKHSTMESIHNYFIRILQDNGTIVEPNKELDLLKSDHYVLGYNNSISKNVRLKIEMYYQHLYDLPVENSQTSYYSTINEYSDYKFVTLVNKGTGKNYGIEATLEKFFNKNYYFLINGSLFDSKYKTLEGVERNTKFNSNFLLNILGGKEFDRLGKKKNHTLNINAKLFFSGGQRYIPLLRDAAGNLAVDPKSNKFWDYNKAYVDKFENIYQINLSVSYKINKQHITHEIFLDLSNVTDNQAKFYEYYDENKPNNIGYIKQAAFVPNIMYRMYF
jgi:outer membrane receptor protein involved in Fe transport